MRQTEIRRLIIHLVRAIAEIPQQDRAIWWEELCAKRRDALSADEHMVLMVLTNLPIGEDLAGRSRAKATRKVIPLQVVRGGKGSAPEPAVKKSRRAVARRARHGGPEDN